MLTLGIFLIAILFAVAQPFSHHIDDKKTGILVPLYRHPGPTWDELIQEKYMHQSVQIVAIINPDNGPGSLNLNYLLGIKKLQTAGIPVLGYVYTKYGNRNSSEIITDIDAYKNLYGVNGMFFDEMSHVAGNEDYYRHLSNYTKSIGLGFTVGNPGRDTLPSYIGTVDNIVIYENSGLPTIKSLESWHTHYPKSNFSILAYGINTLNEKFVKQASHHVGFIYITDQNLPNPWHSLATYFDDLVSSIGFRSDHETNSSIFPEHFEINCNETCHPKL